MPCFKGIAVSVHAEGAPLPEYSVQKHSKTSRITTYIPVPQPKVSSKGASKPEKSKFAISITLLTPNLPIPYSTPKPTPENPRPSPKYVAGKQEADHLGRAASILPFKALTDNPNETVAAYIYFDGRVKEEVATLLRPGEETWVNSRWVQEASGGLAEREFLFREVGLERWLNGLDLEKEGQAAKIERRREKLLKRRERLEQKMKINGESLATKKWAPAGQGLLVYGLDGNNPIELEFSEDDVSDDDEPPESTGQIKVAMFRVVASGDIKKGEYSPQFDANDEGDAMDGDQDDGADHTTSFAKPKALDPSSISTQTVTGLDGPHNPYAVFTFLYRGERQLRKMGILPSTKPKELPQTTGKRSSRGMDFSSLPPLKSGGTVGFTNFRDSHALAPNKSRKKSNSINDGKQLLGGDDSDDDDDDEEVALKEPEEIDDKDPHNLLSPEESRFRGELADGLDRIKLKRQRSHEEIEPLQSPPALASPVLTATPSPDLSSLSQSLPPPPFGMFGGLSNFLDSTLEDSPMKRPRLSSGDTKVTSAPNTENFDLENKLPRANILGAAEAARLEPKTFITVATNSNAMQGVEDM